jgi:cytochrome c553
MAICRRLLTSAAFIGWAAAIPIRGDANAAEPQAGKQKVELCAACHGENGISQTEDTPSLAAQPDKYIQWQLVFFRAGSRRSENMNPIAEQLSNQDVRDLAGYFSSLSPPSPGAAADDRPDLTEAGKQAAVGRRCASCHTESFAGTKATARIAGQREDYITKALHDYKTGVRSGGGGAAMAEVAYPLGENEITALAHYLARLQ